PEAAKPAPAAPAAKPAAAGGPNAKQLADAFGIPYSEQKHSNMRKTVARRLLESKQTVPHFYLTVDIELDALLKLRKELNDRGDVKLSVNDLIIKAAALALRKVPAANTSWTDESMIQYERVDISVAVATPGGLITPIIKDADRKGLGTISGEMKDLAARARDGKLKPEEYQGGTFSISNLGMFGVKDFAAIINPPQSCILAVGAGTQRPVVKDGALAIATVMSCTLSVDHRAVDGAVGAEYLAAFRALVEAPLSMML
ncbi:2-oxo acid dehydrogenase subunit E2, partial [Inquilinus sp. YAF38]|uniref:2-oxo acid dehydrogenase subunit E2 n=1 Tax=Inquilinus sp. YAF38 TaxID=3233084 RepID=UPI003F8F5F92